MPEALPDWFAADQVCTAPDGWYVGVTSGFRIGPFAQQAQAEQHSRALSAELRRCCSNTERVRVVRRFVIQQTREHGRQVRTGAPAAEPAAAEPAAAGPATAGPAPQGPDAQRVRAGETPRVWFRTNRVYAAGGVWFFSTREGIDIGPYATREQAEDDLQCLIDILRRTHDPDRNLAAIRRFQQGLDGTGGNPG